MKLKQRGITNYDPDQVHFSCSPAVHRPAVRGGLCRGLETGCRPKRRSQFLGLLAFHGGSLHILDLLRPRRPGRHHRNCLPGPLPRRNPDSLHLVVSPAQDGAYLQGTSSASPTSSRAATANHHSSAGSSPSFPSWRLFPISPCNSRQWHTPLIFLPSLSRREAASLALLPYRLAPLIPLSSSPCFSVFSEFFSERDAWTHRGVSKDWWPP